MHLLDPLLAPVMLYDRYCMDPEAINRSNNYPVSSLLDLQLQKGTRYSLPAERFHLTQLILPIIIEQSADPFNQLVLHKLPQLFFY